MGHVQQNRICQQIIIYVCVYILFLMYNNDHPTEIQQCELMSKDIRFPAAQCDTLTPSQSQNI